MRAQEAKISGTPGRVVGAVVGRQDRRAAAGGTGSAGGYWRRGKTSLACAVIGVSAAVEQGLNVVIATTETLRVQVRPRFWRGIAVAEVWFENGPGTSRMGRWSRMKSACCVT